MKLSCIRLSLRLLQQCGTGLLVWQAILIDCCIVHLQQAFRSISTAAGQSAAIASSAVFPATAEG